MKVSKAYSVVTDRIIEVIEASDELPWRRPWRKGGKMIVGKNQISGKSYRGINAFTTAVFTEIMGFDSNHWVTYKQARELGGLVQKGEKGIPIVFFKILETQKEMTNLKTGGSESVDMKIPFARYSTVFNLAQCQGIDYDPIPLTDEPEYHHYRIVEIEQKIHSFHNLPKIVHAADDRAFYQPSTDTINIPAMSEFRNPDQFYCTLHHELVHSSGHVDRLNRRTLTDHHGFGSHEYSKEELIAELGACFLNSDADIFDSNLLDSAAYIKGWLKALRENPSWLVQAANAAQKAVDYFKQ